MKLVGFLMQRNEATHGNLARCLDNLARFCDEVVVYDDGSTDDSLDVIRGYTDHVLHCPRADFARETSHRAALLQYALGLEPDWIFWLDADEVLDREGTTGGLRRLCEESSQEAPWDFEEVTLWRSLTWRRLDYLGRGRFNRLWPARSGLSIPVAKGLHNQLYPGAMSEPRPAPFHVLHYGYATQEAIERRWVERTALGVPTEFRRQGLDESAMILEAVPRELFPPGVHVPTDEPRPTPIVYGVGP